MSSVPSVILSIDEVNKELEANKCPTVREYRNDQLGIRVFGSSQNYSEDIDSYETCAKIYVDLRVKLYITFNLLNHGLKTVWEKMAFDKFCNADGCKFISIPIDDYSPIDPLIFVHLWEILDEFNEYRKISGNENDEVLLHCSGGTGRTPFMIMSYVLLKKLENDEQHRSWQEILAPLSREIQIYNAETDIFKKTNIFNSVIFGNITIKFLIDEMIKFYPDCISELTEEDIFLKRIQNLILALDLYLSRPSKDIEYEKKIKGDEMFEKIIDKELLLKIVNGLYEQIMINDTLYKYLEKITVEHVKINIDKSVSIKTFYNVNKMYIYGSYALNVYKHFLELILGKFMVDDNNLFPKPVDYDIMLCFKDLGIRQNLTIDELKKIFINIFREYFEKNYDELNSNNFFDSMESIRSNIGDKNPDNEEETLYVSHSKIELVVIDTPKYKVFRINLAINVNGNIYKGHIIEFNMNFNFTLSSGKTDLYYDTNVLFIEFSNQDKFLVPQFSSLIKFFMQSLIKRGKLEKQFWKCNKDFHRLNYFKSYLMSEIKKNKYINDFFSYSVIRLTDLIYILPKLEKLLNFVKINWYYCTHKTDPKYFEYISKIIRNGYGISELMIKYDLDSYFSDENITGSTYTNKYLKHKKKYIISKKI